ncbi:ABC transporter substrate-binding protein [Saccharibacillus kuerlensis]|uniref:ABC transporter substrate-binding protein n=1 Tax=Saccharibacillus kuerlensis TaxID=459527 RepID=A0ABQ2L7N0_9BACL|nr:ABC transporter substrate-binding protein [Saccharibacillus kuerlensis]GGO06051.1 ABC transporter substrate-binding protein [Saccharibacillus kuerlensis]
MMDKKRKFTGLLMTTALALALSACGGGGGYSTTNEAAADEPSSSGASGSGTAVIGIVNPPTTFNPINPNDTASTQAISVMNDSLMVVNEQLELEPRLAESVETEDNQTFTVHIQDKAVWNDGTDFTSKDVEYTLNMIGNPSVTTNINLSFIEGLNDSGKLEAGQDSVSGFKSVDDKTFTITTKYPVEITYFNDSFSGKIRFLPEHILKDTAPEELDKSPYMQNPTVSIGQFSFVKFAKDQYVQYKANDSYYLGAPKLSELYLKILTAPNLVAQLQTGEVDANMDRTGLIPVEDFEKVSNMTNVSAEFSPISTPVSVMFNVNKMTDPEVRKALELAVNRPQIVEKLLKGNGEIVDNMLPSTHPFYDSSVEPYAYDPEGAKQMLEDAGWDFNQTIQLSVPVGNKVREQAAELMAADWKSIGLLVEIQKFDFPTLLQKLVSNDYEVGLVTIPYTADPSSVYNFFTPNSAMNMTGIDDPKLNSLIEQGAMETDTEARKEVYSQIQQYFHENVPQFAMYVDKLMMVRSNSLDGEVGPDMLNRLYLWEKSE